MAARITVSHCSIYDMPRAGINIGDGCWGGHVIEFCDIFDTVKETGDHGSFNSWGRDRYWLPNIKDVNKLVAANPDLPLLDAVEPNILRNTRWRCDHGWDIDLDDGSTQLPHLQQSLPPRRDQEPRGIRPGRREQHHGQQLLPPACLVRQQRRRLRPEHRLSAHTSRSACREKWGKELISICFTHTGPSLQHPANGLQRASGQDEHSLAATPFLKIPPSGNFRVKEGSPALALGFKNFPMDVFGVQKPSLKAIARTPSFASE